MQPDHNYTSVFLYEYASRVWHRIHFARERNQRISETTVTENLIFDFWYKNKNGNAAIEIYEAKDEKRHGNDLEIFIETRRGYLLMACQAKILNKQNKYPNISHKVGDIYQIDLLLEYAKNKGGLASYLFYNYTFDHDTLDRLEATGKYKHAQFGLTACNAELIKLKFFKPGANALGKQRVKIPKFEDIHPLHGFPLPEMIRILRDETALDTIEELANYIDIPITYYAKKEITGDYHWEPLVAPSKISGITARTKTFSPQNQLKPGFNPKYRIVLPINKQSYRLYSVS
ncbi:hypothetical protein [Mucilaginibacter sp.]|uniref:hypothetical protein n=1 Tax=Mucilaginibacter sp. TaxID=1882438 RepID=UPI003267BFFD